MTSKTVAGLFIRWLLLGLFTAPLLAHAQQAASRTAEPKRFALIIGNAAYTGDSLPPLGTPCSADRNAASDVKLVAGAFTAARWQVEQACNLSTADMRTRINSFNDRVLAEPRAFGVIYYSGHGAQVRGTNYLFGVDAEIDEKLEAAKYAQNNDALLFGGGAISIDEAMLKTRGLWGKGVVVIIDACRDNPLLDALRKRKINTARYPAASLQIPNVVFAFATSAGAVAPDGALGQASRYARFLADAVKTHSNEEIEQVLSVAATSVAKESARDQSPDRIGNLQRPPRFCITGCPSLLSEWQSSTETFGALDRHDAPTFAKVAWRAPQAEAAPLPPPALARAVAVDVLYCGGADANAPFRKQRAARIHDNLAVFRTRPSPVPGLVLGELRLQALAPAANQAQYRATRSGIYFSEESDTLRTLATAISAATVPPLELVAKPGSAPGYLSIIICDGVDVKEQAPMVYIQVAIEQQRAGAKALRGTLQGALPGFRFADGIQQVASSPLKSEVRYFFPQHAERAKELAAASAALLGHPVSTHYIAGYQTKLAGSSLLELWLGKTEKPAPAFAALSRVALR